MSPPPFTALVLKKGKFVKMNYEFHLRQVRMEFVEAIAEGGEYVLYKPYSTCFSFFTTLFALPSANFGISFHPQIRLQWNSSEDDSNVFAGQHTRDNTTDDAAEFVLPRRNPYRIARDNPVHVPALVSIASTMSSSSANDIENRHPDFACVASIYGPEQDVNSEPLVKGLHSVWEIKPFRRSSGMATRNFSRIAAVNYAFDNSKKQILQQGKCAFVEYPNQDVLQVFLGVGDWTKHMLLHRSNMPEFADLDRITDEDPLRRRGEAKKGCSLRDT